MSAPPPLSVAIGRASLSLTPLVIRELPRASSPWWFPEDGVGEVGFSWRTTQAPESSVWPGSLPLGAVLDASTLPLVVYAKSTPTSTLKQAKQALERAVSQFRYRIQVNVAGEVRTYTAFPSWPQWDPADSGMAEAGFDRCSITIPINPEGS